MRECLPPAVGFHRRLCLGQGFLVQIQEPLDRRPLRFEPCRGVVQVLAGNQVRLLLLSN